MKKILPIFLIGVLIISGFGAVALDSNKEILFLDTFNYESTRNSGRDYTHTVLVEVGTGSWCYWCQFTNAAMYGIYTTGDYDFEYIELVDSNPIAVQRINDFNIYGYPTSWFDGGYGVYVGGSDTWSDYTSKMDSCGARSVPDIDSDMNVFWLEDEQIEVSINIQNNENYEYNGHIRAYIVEIVSRWKDYADSDYHHGFLDFAFDQDITINSEETFTTSTIWDGSSWNNPDITMDNIQVILAVFNSEWNQGYSNPPSANPFDAYYVDETIAATPGSPSNPPETPTIPEGPNEGVSGVEYNFSSNTTEPDEDSIFYMFDWGDGNISNWVGPYASGETGEASHSWADIGEYEIKAIAKDINGVKSNWSQSAILSIVENERPERPEIDGKNSGVVGEVYEFTFISNDPEEHDIYYMVDWDDDNRTGWLGPYKSGEIITLNHSWKKKGEYWIKAWAKDIYDDMSAQGNFRIKIQTNRAKNIPAYRNLLTFQILNYLKNRFPIIEYLLNGLRSYIY